MEWRTEQLMNTKNPINRTDDYNRNNQRNSKYFNISIK